jgi:hypothetical protein
VKRSGWIKRHTRLAPGGKPRPRKRSASEFARIYGSKARVAWVKSLPCVAAWGCAGPIHNHHVANGGAGRKANAEMIVPLCDAHHRALHANGAAWFQIAYLLNLDERAERVERLWRAYQERSEER